MTVADFLPPIIAEVRANISDFQAKMAEARGETAALASTGGANIEKFAAVGKGALLGLGAVAVGVGVIGIKAALDMEVAQKRLETAVKNSGQSYGQFSEDVEHAESAGRKLGFTNEDVVNSLAKLQPVTKDVHRSIADLSLAEDIARGRHIDLSTATDILTKVENGRVAMLARIGISTKDATGATISQEEAIRRLSTMYGGQASTYAETFRGRMEALGAQAENIAEKIGQFLIPILTDMGSALADGIGWLTQHKEVMIALGVVVGGALVAAMTAYIATSLIAFATTGSLGTALGFMSSVIFGTVLPALGAMSLAELAVVTGGVALVAGLVYVATQVGDSFSSGFGRAKAAADQWGERTIAAAKATGNELVSLQAAHRLLVSGMHEAAAQGNLSADALINYAEKNKVLTTEIDKVKEAQKQDLVVADAVAKKYGVELPDSYRRNSVEAKAMGKAIAESSTAFGAWATQAEMNAGLGSRAMLGLVKTSQDFAAAMEGSIQKATDPFAHFGGQAIVTEQEMTEFFVGSQDQAAAWADEITALIKRGVDQGIVMEMAQAGPGAKPSVDAFVAMVDTMGVDWVNTTSQKGAEAAAVTEQAFQAMVVSTAIHTAEQAAIVKATTADMMTGGTANLQALAAGADQALAAMAYGVLLHMGEARGAVGDPLVVDIQVSGMNSLDAVISKLNAMPQEARVAIALGYGAHGLVGLARGGAGQIVGPHQPVVIGEGLSREAVVPFDNFGDMVATIRNTGAAGRFMAAAMAAGAGSRMGFSVEPGGDTGGIGGRGPQHVHYHTGPAYITINTPDGKGARREVAAFLEGRN